MIGHVVRDSRYITPRRTARVSLGTSIANRTAAGCCWGFNLFDGDSAWNAKPATSQDELVARSAQVEPAVYHGMTFNE